MFEQVYAPRKDQEHDHDHEQELPPAELRSAITLAMIRCAQGRTDRNGRDGDTGAAGDDVSGGVARTAECAGAYLGENAQAFHPDRSRGQGGGGAFALRPDQGAHHLSREMRGALEA